LFARWSATARGPGRGSPESSRGPQPLAGLELELRCQILTVPRCRGGGRELHCQILTLPSRSGHQGPAPRPGTQKHVPGFVAPPFARLAARGDAGDPGAPTQVFSIPVVQAQRPAPVAVGGDPGPLVGVSLLFGPSTGAALSHCDSALADRG